MSAYLGACALIATFASKVVAVPAPAVGVAPANGQPVTGGCPSGEQSYVFNNVVYSICPNTDFNVDNILDTKAASPQACAETCNKTPNCKYVVYEPNGGCHVKASSANPNWKVSNYYSTITAVYQVQQGQQITGSCPFNQTTLLGKNNAVWGICPQSDYNVDNANTIKAASQAACADACTSTQGCKYTVWEPTGYCHLKVQTNNSNWKADNYYTTMASLYTLNNGQQLTNGCLGGQKQVTTSNGATFTVCPWADFNVDNVANKQVYDDKSCAEYCSQTQGCKYAVYEPPTGACFLKGSPASPNMKQSNYYTAVYASSASTGAPLDPVAREAIPTTSQPTALRLLATALTLAPPTLRRTTWRSTYARSLTTTSTICSGWLSQTGTRASSGVVRPLAAFTVYGTLLPRCATRKALLTSLPGSRMAHTTLSS